MTEQDRIRELTLHALVYSRLAKYAYDVLATNPECDEMPHIFNRKNQSRRAAILKGIERNIMTSMPSENAESLKEFMNDDKIGQLLNIFSPMITLNAEDLDEIEESVNEGIDLQNN